MIDLIELTPERWQEFKQIRLEALEKSPAAFSAKYEEAVAKPDSYWQGRLAETLSGESILVFAHDPIEQKIVGMAGVFFPKQESVSPSQVDASSKSLSIAKPRNPQVFGVYVNEKYRGQGIASRMMQYLTEKVAALPACSGLQLEVACENPAALNLYKKMGFVESAEQPDKDLIKMEKSL